MSKQTLSPQFQAADIPKAHLPVRCVQRHFTANQAVESHQHPWGQMIFSAQGVVRVYLPEQVFTLPPYTALFIASDCLHRIEIVEQAQLYSLNVWQALRFPSQIIHVAPLLFELVVALSACPCSTARYALLSQLILLEIEHSPYCVGIQIPFPKEKRLHHFCQRFLQAPTIKTNLAELARESGASVSTIHRLFKQELGCSFGYWRQQVLLSHALMLHAQGCSQTHIALALGYNSASAFAFMVKQLVGISFGELCRGGIGE